MKIGILTFHNNTNYGSWLQTYALYRMVKEEGYDVEVIDFMPSVIPGSEMITFCNLKDVFSKYKNDSFFYLKRICSLQSEFQKYKKKYFCLSKDTYTIKNVDKLNFEYDIFLIGSDLVWDIRYAIDDVYMLDFVKGCKGKIAYAASYGYERIPQKERDKFSKCLSTFHQITMRESCGSRELTELLGKKVEHVCDPTMLLNNNVWTKFVKSNSQTKEYVLVYMPDEKGKVLQCAKRYGRKHRCKVLIIGKNKGAICPMNISEFLTLFYHASKIFTGSYHGLLFSIYFKKQFAYAERIPQNRFRSLSDVLSIGKYEITHPEFDVEREVDFEVIKKEEALFRNSSKLILKKMLSDTVKEVS